MLSGTKQHEIEPTGTMGHRKICGHHILETTEFKRNGCRFVASDWRWKDIASTHRTNPLVLASFTVAQSALANGQKFLNTGPNQNLRNRFNGVSCNTRCENGLMHSAIVSLCLTFLECQISALDTEALPFSNGTTLDAGLCCKTASDG